MEKISLKPIEKIGPLFVSEKHRDYKDPCVAYDGKKWHLYGSGGNSNIEEWNIIHFTSDNIRGPWTEEEPPQIALKGNHVAAPGVVFDPTDGRFHMALQQDFTAIGESLHYLVSDDGHKFDYVGVILNPKEDGEAGLYDPHFSIIDGRKILVYSGMPAEAHGGRAFVPQPDIYLAESDSSWAGPWKRIKKILDHDEIKWHHNRPDFHDYEWGIEGPQLVSLPDGSYLLNATCFIEEGERGTRQRVFFARSRDMRGPFESFGPILRDRDNFWESGENGHASVFVLDNCVFLFYQARAYERRENFENNWKYGIAVFEVKDIIAQVT